MVSATGGASSTLGGGFVIIRWGCGTGCTSGVVGDHHTGEIYPLGLGGEDMQALSLRYDNTSTAILARWSDGARGLCVTQNYNWTGSSVVASEQPQEWEMGDRSCDATYADWFLEQ